VMYFLGLPFVEGGSFEEHDGFDCALENVGSEGVSYSLSERQR
jgi:hypothetical protein